MDHLEIFLSAAKGMLKNFLTDIFKFPMNLLLAIYLAFPRMLFKMGPEFLFNLGVELLKVHGCLTWPWMFNEATADSW